MEKLIYTWEQQIDDTNLICAKIEADGFKPDVIVGISRGGLIPGVMISHKLNIPFKPVHASTRDFPHWENYLPKSNDSKEKDESDINKVISDIFEKLNLSSNKAEKDIGIYKSTLSKMKQAKELIVELRIKDKKKGK